jgi:lipid-binding SYLF domain-containing protein
LLRTAGGRWTNPAFFNLGGISIGLQAGGTTGQIAYVLMTDNAVRQFETGNQFSLSAGAGLHVANFRGGQRADLTGNDVVAWSNTTGAYGGVDVGATNVSFDRQLTSDFYGMPDVGLRQVLDGQVRSADADSLRRAMPR